MPRENTKIAIRALNSLYEVVMDIYKNTDENAPRNDYNLIKNQVHEQAIAHRIAYYLENNLGLFLENNNLSIDCEYNKHKYSHKYYDCDISKYKNTDARNIINKMINEIIKKYKEEKFDYCDEDIKISLQEKTFRPDIILHERFEDKKNILYIEVKKGRNKEEVAFDKIKLKCATNKKTYNYIIGILIELKEEEPEFTCFTSNYYIKAKLESINYKNFIINPKL